MIQIYILKHFINLTCNISLHSLHLGINLQMFLNCHITKNRILLRTNSHQFLNLFPLIINIITHYSNRTTRFLQKTRKHRYSCGFTSSIMSQKTENLRRKHFHIQVINSNFSIGIDLFKFVNFYSLIEIFLVKEFFLYSLKIFKLLIFIIRHHLLVFFLAFVRKS